MSIGGIEMDLAELVGSIAINATDGDLDHAALDDFYA
jgi:hypothetical protein